MLQEERVKRQQAEVFSSSISHEIRTPLNSILFFLNLVKKILLKFPQLPNEFTTEVTKYINLSMSQLTFSLTFVDDVLDLHQYGRARVSDAFSLSMAAFNPNKVLNTIRDVFKPQAEAKGIGLIVQTTQDLDLPSASHIDTTALMIPRSECRLPHLVGDERRLKQVLVNLIRNAIKFTTQG